MKGQNHQRRHGSFPSLGSATVRPCINGNVFKLEVDHLPKFQRWLQAEMRWKTEQEPEDIHAHIAQCWVRQNKTVTLNMPELLWNIAHKTEGIKIYIYYFIFF